MEKAHQTCTGPTFPRILMNKAQDSCTGPRIPRFFGTLPGSCLIVPENLGILGNLGPVHESCTLFIRNLGNLGPVQVLFPSVILKSYFLLQYLYGRKRRRFWNIIGDNVPNSCLARKFEVPNGHNVEKRIIKGSKKKWTLLGVINVEWSNFFGAIFLSMLLFLWTSHFDQFLCQKLYYLDDPIHFLFTSCSFPLHSYLYFLFIAYSFLFILIHFFSFPIYFLFIAYSFPFHVHSFFSLPLIWEVYQSSQKQWVFPYQSLI